MGDANNNPPAFVFETASGKKEVVSLQKIMAVKGIFDASGASSSSTSGASGNFPPNSGVLRSNPKQGFRMPTKQSVDSRHFGGTSHENWAPDVKPVISDMTGPGFVPPFFGAPAVPKRRSAVFHPPYARPKEMFEPRAPNFEALASRETESHYYTPSLMNNKRSMSPTSDHITNWAPNVKKQRQTIPMNENSRPSGEYFGRGDRNVDFKPFVTGKESLEPQGGQFYASLGRAPKAEESGTFFNFGASSGPQVEEPWYRREQ